MVHESRLARFLGDGRKLPVRNTACIFKRKIYSFGLQVDAVTQLNGFPVEIWVQERGVQGSDQVQRHIPASHGCRLVVAFGVALDFSIKGLPCR